MYVSGWAGRTPSGDREEPLVVSRDPFVSPQTSVVVSWRRRRATCPSPRSRRCPATPSLRARPPPSPRRRRRPRGDSHRRRTRRTPASPPTSLTWRAASLRTPQWRRPASTRRTRPRRRRPPAVRHLATRRRQHPTVTAVGTAATACLTMRQTAAAPSIAARTARRSIGRGRGARRGAPAAGRNSRREATRPMTQPQKVNWSHRIAAVQLSYGVYLTNIRPRKPAMSLYLLVYFPDVQSRWKS